MARTKKLSIDPHDRDFTGILICAVRYCLGRRTYMPGLVTTWIKRNLDGFIDKIDIDVMLQDIARQEELPGGIGDLCDIQVWNQFKSWLVSQKSAKVD